MTDTNNGKVWVIVLGYWDDGDIEIFSTKELADKRIHSSDGFHGPYEHTLDNTSEEM